MARYSACFSSFLMFSEKSKYFHSLKKKKKNWFFPVRVPKLQQETSTQFFQNWWNISVKCHKRYKKFGKENSFRTTRSKIFHGTVEGCLYFIANQDVLCYHYKSQQLSWRSLLLYQSFLQLALWKDWTLPSVSSIECCLPGLWWLTSTRQK